jgi:unsaturated rhamnogalacturonyl hydrolase
MGWYLMALVDTMDNMSFEIFEQYKKLEGIFKQILHGLLQYQDKESRLFYQVVDRGDTVGNYLETSGSAMIAYAILKGCRMGILLSEKYAGVGEEILNSLLENKLIEKEGKLHLTGICQMAGLGPENNPARDGSVEYYLSEKIVEDDPKGVGPLMMAYGQYLLLKKEME